ncbi:MAG TPA: efflux RND transporter periplasmic adaptor subunit [Vicinamibacteria bacterium]|nr:efflux RND transporter periplasmic adaptor subunit [Vicinamibacteria bacterium]
MKAVLALASFSAGVVLAVFLMTNPFHWWWLGAQEDAMEHDTSSHAQEGAPAEVQGERKIKYWRAPMDPTFISDKPGKSPMGMDLIPVYEGEEDALAPGTIKIDPVFVQNIGVVSEEIERTDILFNVRTVGTLAYNESQIAWVNTKYEGWIEKAYVNYVGEPVTRGQKLFEIYSPQLVTTQKEYLLARDYAKQMEQSDYPEITRRAQSLLASSRERLKYWDITDEQISELEREGTLRRTLAVVSPVNGLVVEKMSQALEGMDVKPGMNLYQIVDLSTIWVEVEVFESQAPWLEVGSRADIELPYERGRKFPGRVRYLYPFFNEKTRTMKVSIELSNPGQRLRADMYANVTFDVPSAEDVLAVPEAAVIHSGQRTVVVVDRGNGTFEVKEVTLGVNGSGLWEVKDGLEEGDRIVVSAQFLIDSESNLQEAIRKITSSGSGEAAPMPGHKH